MTMIPDNRVSECIRRFLRARVTPGNQDLVAFWEEHCPHLETQLLTHPGRAVEGKSNVWTDGDYQWWNIRIPKHADSEPEFRDYQLDWPLDPYVLGIGSTGWDWHHRRSCYVGFDFDAMVNHARGVGIPDGDLTKIQNAVQAVPYVEVRRSTGGFGIHLYVRFNPSITTKNHTEHAQLARVVLDKISHQIGFALSDHVDAVGGNMWIWHRKLEKAK